MKFLKRLLAVLAILLLGVLLLAAMSWHLLNRKPDYYRAYAWDPAQQRLLNQRAVDKFTQTRNFAASALARETSARRQGATLPATQPAFQVTFTEEELNAFLLHNFKEQLDPYVANAGIFLKPDTIILAGEIKDLDYLVSFHFQPKLTDKGRLDLRLTSTNAGRLPLPQALLSGQLSRVKLSLQSKMPAWKQQARLDHRGANKEAVKAAMAQLLLNMLDEKTSDPILFMPDEGERSLPVKIAGLKVEKGVLAVELAPMSGEERRDLDTSIRSLSSQ